MTRNCIWMGVFSQVVTVSLLQVTAVHIRRPPPCECPAGKAALVSASEQWQRLVPVLRPGEQPLQGPLADGPTLRRPGVNTAEVPLGAGSGVPTRPMPSRAPPRPDQPLRRPS